MLTTKRDFYMKANFIYPATRSSRSGWLHVCPRRCSQHVREPKVRLFIQGVVGGSQPAGIDLGEAAENVPSRSPAVHASAAQPGADAHTNSATEIEGVDTFGSGT